MLLPIVLDDRTLEVGLCQRVAFHNGEVCEAAIVKPVPPGCQPRYQRSLGIDLHQVLDNILCHGGPKHFTRIDNPQLSLRDRDVLPLTRSHAIQARLTRGLYCQ